MKKNVEQIISLQIHYKMTTETEFRETSEKCEDRKWAKIKCKITFPRSEIKTNAPLN